MVFELGAKSLSPPSTAVTGSSPTGRSATTSIATPVALATAPDPSVVVPLSKVTLPEGWPSPGETARTVEVRVTAVPNDAVAVLAASAVVVPAWLTTSASGNDVAAG